MCIRRIARCRVVLGSTGIAGGFPSWRMGRNVLGGIQTSSEGQPGRMFSLTDLRRFMGRTTSRMADGSTERELDDSRGASSGSYIAPGERPRTSEGAIRARARATET